MRTANVTALGRSCTYVVSGCRYLKSVSRDVSRQQRRKHATSSATIVINMS